jgi:hypothetical protein
MISLCTKNCTKTIEQPNSEIYEDDELDELIKSMDESSSDEDSTDESSSDEYSTNEYSCIDDIENPIVQDISNDNHPTVADWNALINAAKLANENNKRREEVAANIKIAEYTATHTSRSDRAIRRTFRVKGGGAHRI